MLCGGMTVLECVGQGRCCSSQFVATGAVRCGPGTGCAWVWSGTEWHGRMWLGAIRDDPVSSGTARYNFLIPYPSALCSMAVRCCPSSFCSGPILQFMPPARHNFSIPCQPAWCSATVCFPSLYPVPAQHCNSMLPVPVCPCPCPGLSPVRSGGRWSGIIFRSRLSFSREG